jgi:hypothetical protein
VEKNLKQAHAFIEAMNVLPFEDCVETFAKERVSLRVRQRCNESKATMKRE